jgi:gliding motility-associated-like protein
MKQFILIIILTIICNTNLNYSSYQPNVIDLYENTNNILNQGDPIPGLDISLSTEYKVHYKVTAVSKENNDICSVSNTIEVSPSMYIYVPNSFTPNDDGLNDSFGGLGHGVKDYHLIIYNRWGELIFESDSMNKQWDGNYHGESAPIGSYIYNIDSTGYYNQDFHKEGMVSIIKV